MILNRLQATDALFAQVLIEKANLYDKRIRMVDFAM